MSIFEKATRGKMRFQFKGLVSVEDLWDLSVQDLDKIFKSLNSQKKQVEEESLLNVKTEADTTLDIQIEIVKYIVSIKLEEENARLQLVSQKQKKDKIIDILASKQDEDLKNKSVEELKDMLNELK